MDPNAKARAKKAKEDQAEDNVIIADQLGISRESALNPTRAKTRAKVSKDNAATAEKLDIQPANVPRAKEMKREPGAREDTKEP